MMKNLANCTPSEFLKQSNKVKKSAERWLKATDIMNIRKAAPKIIMVTDDMSDDKKREILKENRDNRKKQLHENLSKMLDSILDEHPDETLELLALLCFIEPEDVDNHPVGEYLASINEMLGSEAVIGFFTSLGRWARMNT